MYTVHDADGRLVAERDTLERAERFAIFSVMSGTIRNPEGQVVRSLEFKPGEHESPRGVMG